MKFISLFAGVGGFDLALERAGHECVYANDIDKYCKITYDKHFKTKLDTRSITEVEVRGLPEFDLLVGGFPCQSFSIAGKRGGFSDTRGTLFFEIVRIVKQKQPRLLILENVKGLLSHDKGKTFTTIINTLDELGYDLQWQVLNSKNFGVPQNRERVFIIGHLRGTPRPQVFPITGAEEEDTRIIGQDVAYTIDANYHKGTNTLAKSRRSIVQVNNPKHSNDRVYDKSGISPTLNTMQGGRRQPFVSYNTHSKGKRYRKKLGVSTSLLANPSTSYGLLNDIRRLTPLECERLQGFPDGWTEGVSDTQRYKQMGNAVTVNVIEAIVKRI